MSLVSCVLLLAILPREKFVDFFYNQKVELEFDKATNNAFKNQADHKLLDIHIQIKYG